jgi:hypothetical protein
MTRQPQWPWVCARLVANETNQFLEFRTRLVFSCALESHESIVQWNHPNATPTARRPVKWVTLCDWGGLGQRENCVRSSSFLPRQLWRGAMTRWRLRQPARCNWIRRDWFILPSQIVLNDVVCAKRLISWWLQLMPCHGCKLDENHMVMWVTFGYVIYWSYLIYHFIHGCCTLLVGRYRHWRCITP